jgi:glycosyltransferase involved in cell wall biosynthesis
MRVLISGLSAPTQLNGVSRHAANLVRGLLSLPDAPEIHFLAGEWQTVMYSRAIGLADERLHIHPISIPHRNLARVRWYYRQLPRIARCLDADLVHLSYTMPLDAGAFRCPTVVSLHDLYPFDIPENFGWVKGPVNRELMHQCLRTVDAIACVSESTRTRLRQRLGAKISRKSVTISNAVGPIPSTAAQRPPGLGDEPFILSVAQHRQNKNIPLALTIFERLLGSGVVPANSRFVVVGIPGPDTKRIHAEMRSLGLERSVVLCTGISDAELQWCYRNCRLLLAPSSIEGFGLPVAEALMAGCSVVCSDIAAFREIGGRRCTYVQFGDGIVERYQRAVREALEQSRPVPATFPQLMPQAIAREYMSLYARLLATRGRVQTDALLYAESN